MWRAQRSGLGRHHEERLAVKPTAMPTAMRREKN